MHRNFFNQVTNDGSWFNIARGYITELALSGAFFTLATGLGKSVTFGSLFAAESAGAAVSFFQAFNVNDRTKLIEVITSGLAALGCAEVLFISDDTQYIPAPALFALALAIQALKNAHIAFASDPGHKRNFSSITAGLRATQSASLIVGLIFGIGTQAFMWVGAASSFFQILTSGCKDYIQHSRAQHSATQPLIDSGPESRPGFSGV